MEQNPTPAPQSEAPPVKRGGKLKIAGIGCGGLLFACVALAIIVSAFGGDTGTEPRDTVAAAATATVEVTETPEVMESSTASDADSPDAEDATEPTPESAAPTEEPAAVGMSRSNPYSSDDLIAAPNLDVRVLETQRGDAAWASIEAANMFNQPPAEGREYVLVKLSVTSTHSEDAEHWISGGDFRLTGDRLIEYGSPAVVEPEPQLDAQLFPGGTAEGWVAFEVAQGEGNLILIVDELLNFDSDRRRFIALDQGASLTVAHDLAEIERNDLGEDRSDPTPFGETATTEEWQIAVREVVRGEEAWAMIQDANEFNEPADPGMEYLAVKVWTRYISSKDEPATIDAFAFDTVGESNVRYDTPAVVDPSPALDARLYPGGISEGWIVLQAAEGESGVMMVFDPAWDFLGKNKRFFALE